jgi:glycerophosphoryl diester phosphodiesterase
MDTVKFDKKNTKMIAHRGLSGIELENTCSAFVAAGNRSYYGIETDIYKTADGHFIVGHDDNYKRISGEEIYLEKETLARLQEVVFFDKDGTKGRVDLRPATLENYLSIVKKYEKHAILELKSDFTDEEIAKIIEIIKSYDYLDNLTFISFNYENLKRVRKILPNQSAQYLFWKLTDEEIARLKEDKIDADVWCIELTEEQIKKAHEAGLSVNCWTVNEKENGEKFASWGIDYITSNILE